MASTFDEVPSQEVGAAAWLVDARLSGRGMLVGSFLPAGFEAYARILRPALAGDRSATWASDLVERLIGDDLLEVVEAKLDDPFNGHRR